MNTQNIFKLTIEEQERLKKSFHHQNVELHPYATQTLGSFSRSFEEFFSDIFIDVFTTLESVCESMWRITNQSGCEKALFRHHGTKPTERKKNIQIR